MYKTIRNKVARQWGRAENAKKTERFIRRLKPRLTSLLMYILLLDMVFIFFFPFLIILTTSLKTNTDLVDLSVNWIPGKPEWNNFKIAYDILNYFQFFKNSLLVTLLSTIGHILSCSFIGYGFARYEFPGKKFLFFIVIVALIVPIQTMIVPSYMIYANLKWLDSYLPLIIPTFLGYGLFGPMIVFIFRQFYLSFPKELENAARIDGCGFLRVYARIVLPTARPPLLVAFVLSMVWHWNDFYEPMIYATKPELALLPARLNAIIAAVTNPPIDLDTMAPNPDLIINEAVLMAGMLLVILPLILIFAFLQKKFIQSIEHTGLTG